MNQLLRIEGIYDLRTLKFLKQQGIKDFTFDFSPTSFNFLQKHIFLENFLKCLDSNDRLYFHFSRSNDPMVFLIAEDMKREGLDFDKIYFEFDSWSAESDFSRFNFNFLLSYDAFKEFYRSLGGTNFKGIVFNVQFFDQLQQTGMLSTFVSNFLTQFHHVLNDQVQLVLKMDWGHNVMTSLFDYFDFSMISMPINSKIEVCYRNVDLKKLNAEMNIFKKNNFLTGP